MRLSCPLAAVLLLMGSASFAASPTVSIYPAPAGEKPSPDYEVDVDGRPVFVHTARVLHGGPASFAQLDADGPVTINVTVRGKIDGPKVRPASYGIQAAVDGQRLTLAVAKPAHLTIEPAGKIERPLHLSINPPERDAPTRSSDDVIYFGPGVHEVTTLRPKTGQRQMRGGSVRPAWLCMSPT